MKTIMFFQRTAAFTLLIFMVVTGCNNTSGPDASKLLRSGTSSAGRAFDIFAHSLSDGTDTFKLNIDGEAAIIFGENSPIGLEALIETVTVEELSGTPVLIQLTWES
jgi:hypothetical protein